MENELVYELKKWLDDELKHACETAEEYLAVLRVQNKIRDLEEDLRADLRV